MRRGFAAATLVLLTAGVAEPATANHVCYPSTCPGGDAALIAINTPPGGLARGAKNSVSVDGTNNGDDAIVKTKLKAKPGKVKPHKVKMFVPADTDYTVFFRVKEKKKEKKTTADLLACTTAKKDIDKTNDCGSTSVPIV